jgi:folate-binding protein YgfZ
MQHAATPEPGETAMTDRRGLVDTRRAILRIEGSDARPFLQGLVTNDINRLASGRAVYAALLSPQGKYLFDFVLVEAPDGAILLDVADDRAAALLQRLSLYRLRRAVTVAAAEGLGVALVWGDAPAAGAVAVPDPRHPALGWRLYAADPLAALAEAGATPATFAAYDALRLAHAVPDSGSDLIPDDTYILEAGFERLNGVDFRKGCYVGQEVTARMHHKTELRKGLLPVRVEGAAPPPGTPVLMADGRAAGTLHSAQDGLGLAHLRFDRLDGPLTAGEARVIPQPG